MRPNDSSARPAGIHQARPDDRHVGVGLEHVEQAIDRAGRHDRVAVEEQEVRAAAGTNADVRAAREPEVVARLDDAHAGVPPRGVGAAVRRRVVHDDHLVAARGRRVVQRLQAAIEIGAGVERHDDDGKIHGRCVRTGGCDGAS